MPLSAPKSRFLRLALVPFGFLALAGCVFVQNTSLQVATLNAVGVTGGSGATNIFVLRSIQGQAPAQFSVGTVVGIGTQAAFFPSRVLAIKMGCLQAMTSVLTSINGVLVGGAALCPAGGGDVSFNVTLGADGLYALSFMPLGAAGVSVAQPISQAVYAKTTTPPQLPLPYSVSPPSGVQVPVALTSHTPFEVHPGAVVVNGAMSVANGDFALTDYIAGIQETTFRQGTLVPTLAVGVLSFTDTFNFQVGSAGLSFVVVDLAGNLSGPTVIQISSTSSLLNVTQAASAGIASPIVSANSTLGVVTSAPVLSPMLTGATSYLYLGIPSNEAEE